MNPDDIIRRAGAQCLAAEPHAGRLVEWPCADHVNDAKRQLSAPASSTPSGATRLLAGVDDGGPGRASVPPSDPGGASTSAMDNPQEGQLLGAERATAIARKQVTP